MVSNISDRRPHHPSTLFLCHNAKLTHRHRCSAIAPPPSIAMPCRSNKCHPLPVAATLRRSSHSVFQTTVLSFPSPPPFAGKLCRPLPPPPPLELLLALLAVLRPPSTVTKLVAALIWAKIWRSDERGTSDMKKMGQNIAKANEHCRNGVVLKARLCQCPFHAVVGFLLYRTPPLLRGGPAHQLERWRRSRWWGRWVGAGG
ncbi:hypothetical protein JHK85_048641 [Glycine max]|nr:hypothetical protein JHK85_048641 [Glycine max]